MNKVKRLLVLILASALLLSGCAMATLDKLYCLPKRSEEYENLQAVFDKAMQGLQYCAPINGDNRLVHQTADLDGDGVDEYLIFAKDDSAKPLKILIFAQLASGPVLMDTIEGYGFGYDFVSYAELDDRPGVELIVGRQVSDQVMRSVAVYRFSSGFARQLMNTSYHEITSTDMNRDGIAELFVLTAGPSEKSAGSARMFTFQDGDVQRSAEIPLSAPMSGFKMLSNSVLEDQVPAIFVTSTADNQNLVTDIFVMNRGELTTLVSGLSISSVENYYVFPEDINGDGVMELPRLLPLQQMQEEDPSEYIIDWYQLSSQLQEHGKLLTYHNYAQNWYLEVDRQILQKLSVAKTENGTDFFYGGEKLMTIMALTDADREEQSKLPGSTVLYGGETVIYVAIVEENTASKDNIELLIRRFHPIRVELNTEEDKIIIKKLPTQC